MVFCHLATSISKELEIVNLSVICLPKFVILSSVDKPGNQTDESGENEKRDPDCEEITERKRPAVQNQRKNDCRGRSLTPAPIDEGSDVWSLSFWK
jgi:hypothetical protein